MSELFDFAQPSHKVGLPIVISAPSGTGKSTIVSKLVSKMPSLALSISCTTREPRKGEKDGVHYFFTHPDDFKKKIEAGEFLEWAVVHGHYYGTPLKALEKQLQQGQDVVLTIDPQGAMSLKRTYPGGIYIFVVPPSWDALSNRLKIRATDDKKTIELRIANARKELSYLGHYDYLVINDDLEAAVRNVASIITTEHLKTSRVDQKLLKNLM